MEEFGPESSNHTDFHELSRHSNGTEGWWKTYGTSVSLGILATIVLISMFVIMAIIEHLYRLNDSLRPTQHVTHRPVHKLVDPQPQVQARDAPDLSVLMPGEMYPTYIAHPTPLPCSREGEYWPSHCVHGFVLP